jgi:hypothetical protein
MLSRRTGPDRKPSVLYCFGMIAHACLPFPSISHFTSFFDVSSFLIPDLRYLCSTREKSSRKSAGRQIALELIQINAGVLYALLAARSLRSPLRALAFALCLVGYRIGACFISPPAFDILSKASHSARDLVRSRPLEFASVTWARHGTSQVLKVPLENSTSSLIPCVDPIEPNDPCKHFLPVLATQDFRVFKQQLVFVQKLISGTTRTPLVLRWS